MLTCKYLLLLQDPLQGFLEHLQGSGWAVYLNQRHLFKVLVSSRLGKTHIVPVLMTEKVQSYPVPKKVEGYGCWGFYFSSQYTVPVPYTACWRKGIRESHSPRNKLPLRRRRKKKKYIYIYMASWIKLGASLKQAIIWLKCICDSGRYRLGTMAETETLSLGFWSQLWKGAETQYTPIEQQLLISSR